MSKFKLKSDYKPSGDQPQAISSLLHGLKKGQRYQTLLGVTGSGKTFTIANIIEKVQKSTLVIAHNKTLAAQLAQEFKDFFPDNAVHYFVSYYDYYQPEAYMPITDTYIEKEAQINEEIDRLRHACTQALLTRKDVIIVASVSCIYNLGSPQEYKDVNLMLEKGIKITRTDLIRKLIDIYFERTNSDLTPGKFRAVGNTLEIMPVNEKVIYRLEFIGNEIREILILDGVSSTILERVNHFFLFPAKHFVSNKKIIDKAIKDIKRDLKKQLESLERAGKDLEAQRLKRRTNYDLAMIREVGYCNGIENYSRYFSNKSSGDSPDSLLEYFPHKKNGNPDFLTVIDESHITVPQIGAMYSGDQSRKQTLIDYGFRLPSAKDNRPLKFEEFEVKSGETIFTSATPGKYEKEKSKNIAQQIIRPTGLVDPVIDIRPIISSGKDNYEGQVYDFINEAIKEIKNGGRVMATTLTKKMAEDLSSFLIEKGINAKYLHSDIDTIERIEIITDFRKGGENGGFDCLVGVNLLREGLDMPEVTLIGILDADKEGFLRSETSLIQTIGRAARNESGRVILYADKITGSIERAVGETNRRREIQLKYNKDNGITPKTIIKKIADIRNQLQSKHQKTLESVMTVDIDLYKKNPKKFIKEKEKKMTQAVKDLDFETAAIIRDELRSLRELK